VEEIAEPLMREIRYLDKLVDELAKGKSMEKIMRKEGGGASRPAPARTAAAAPSYTGAR
jgi:hypothetical protein